MPGLVKIFLRVLNVFLIIFLTGCADQRYHKTVSVAGPIPARPEHPEFLRPLEGPVLFRYGEREDGVALKGVVYQGAEGQEVVAAQAGRVVYADDSLRGYGKTLILEHARDYSTVYARNSQVLVGLGDEVRRGQTIARAGSNGRGAAPQIYFEVRRNARPLDPEQVLR